MAFNHLDWTILRTTGANPNEIDYVGDAHAGTAPSYATGIELHRALQDFADDSTDGTEEVSIIDEVPSQRGGVDTNITLLNGYHLTPTAAEHIYDTSISQTHPVNGGQIYDGIQVFGNAVYVNVFQSGVRLTNDFWNEPKMIAAVEDSVSATTHRFMVLVRDYGVDIDGRRLVGTQREYGTQYTEFAIGGGTNRGNNVLALTANSNLNNQTASGTIATYSGTLALTEGYSQEDGDGDTIDENYLCSWDITAPRTKNDLYEFSQYQQRRGSAETLWGMDAEEFRGATHAVAYDGLSGTFTTALDIVWGTKFSFDAELAADGTVGEYYDFSLSGATGKLLALDVTNNEAIFAITPGSGTVVDNDVVTRSDGTAADGFTVAGTPSETGVVGGRARILADDGSANMWIQLLEGLAPGNDVPIWETSIAGVFDNTSVDDALVNGTPASLTISSPWLGASTGANIKGAFGVGIADTDLESGDTLIDLTGTANDAPNNVSFNVLGINITTVADYILVGPDDGGGNMDFNQLEHEGGTTGGTVTSIVVTDSTIPADTPTSGTIRITRVSGEITRHTYSARTLGAGNAFTIPSTDFSTDGIADNGGIMVSYIDAVASSTTESFNTVFSAPRTLRVRARNGGTVSGLAPIVPIEVSATLGSSGGSTTLARVLDT